jgi:hypothetical protein
MDEILPDFPMTGICAVILVRALCSGSQLPPIFMREVVR